MAGENQVKRLTDAITKILSFQNNQLVSRPQWGTINFIKAESDLKRIFSMLNNLKVMPLEHLTDEAINEITARVNEIEPFLRQIDLFNIEQNGASQLRDQYIVQIHGATEQLSKFASPWIPFLAYQKGDVARNIEALSDSLRQATVMTEQAQQDIAAKAKEIDVIITKAREASASAGAAVFTQDFKNEADRLTEQAKPWLRATGWFAALTLLIAGITWYWTQEKLDNGQIFQKVASKIVALSVLVTGTLWCGKIYKALMHQAAVNRHRALSLQTFQAFSVAGSDNQTKDAVLMETTRAIFANSATGYISPEAESGDSESRIIEIAKSIVPSNKP